MIRHLFLFFLITVTMVVFSACSEPETITAPTSKPIAWLEVKKSTFEQIRKMSGLLKSAESTQLSFQVSGKIKHVYSKLGDSIKKGQILAQLDKSNYNLSMRAAKGQLQDAKAVLIDARSTFERQSTLYRKDIVSKADYDNAKAALDRAKSLVEVASAQLALAQKDIRDTSLFAPYDGQITKRLIDPSQTISSGQPCFEISGNQGLEISIMIPETIVNYLDKQHLYKVSFPSLPDITTKARISQISSKAETANAFPFTLELNKQNQHLRAGMTAEVVFIFKDPKKENQGRDIVRIPPEAIMTGEKDTSYVFVYDKPTATVKKRKIVASNIINNEVYVSEGLSPGEIIATAGVVFLYDGQPVRLMNVGPEIYN